MTPDDLWPPPKNIGHSFSLWWIHIPSIKSIQASYLEISCKQGFQFLALGDPRWPLTSTKNYRIHLLTITHPCTKYEINPSFLPWDIVLTTSFQCLTPSDPRWPLTSTKSYTIHLLTITHPHTTYPIYPSFLPWDIVLTRFLVFDPWWPQVTFDLHQKQ